MAGLTLDDAYRVTALLNRRREAGGEKRLGRKIGFTNRTIWEAAAMIVTVSLRQITAFAIVPGLGLACC